MKAWRCEMQLCAKQVLVSTVFFAPRQQSEELGKVNARTAIKCFDDTERYVDGGHDESWMEPDVTVSVARKRWTVPQSYSFITIAASWCNLEKWKVEASSMRSWTVLTVECANKNSCMILDLHLLPGNLERRMASIHGFGPSCWMQKNFKLVVGHCTMEKYIWMPQQVMNWKCSNRGCWIQVLR